MYASRARSGSQKSRLTQADLEGQTILDAQTRRTSTAEEKFELIAAGAGIALVPLSVARYYARPDLVHRLVTDAERYEICLAVAEDQCRGHVQDFLRVAIPALHDRRA